MYVDIPDYLFPKLKKTAQNLNIPVSELVVDALVSYVQDLEEAAISQPNDDKHQKKDRHKLPNHPAS